MISPKICDNRQISWLDLIIHHSHKRSDYPYCMQHNMIIQSTHVHRHLEPVQQVPPPLPSLNEKNVRLQKLRGDERGDRMCLNTLCIILITNSLPSNINSYHFGLLLSKYKTSLSTHFHLVLSSPVPFYHPVRTHFHLTPYQLCSAPSPLLSKYQPTYPSPLLIMLSSQVPFYQSTKLPTQVPY